MADSETTILSPEFDAEAKSSKKQPPTLAFALFHTHHRPCRFPFVAPQ
jgi:hypothetical protein